MHCLCRADFSRNCRPLLRSAPVALIFKKGIFSPSRLFIFIKNVIFANCKMDFRTKFNQFTYLNNLISIYYVVT